VIQFLIRRSGATRGASGCVLKVLFTVLSALFAFAANAATITVTSLADPGNAGTCTLRQAIEAANTDTAVGTCAQGLDVDTIVFDAALNLTAATPGTITLDQSSMSEAPFSGSATINWLLTAKGDLTITGPGSAALTINGGGLSPTSAGKRILRVTDNDSLIARSISISGVSFKYGRNAIVGSSTTGGCVSSSESITLNDVVFEGCEVFSLSGNVAGGALFVGIPVATVTTSLPNVSLTNVAFLRNRAIHGAPTAAGFENGGAAILGDPAVKVGTVSITGSRFVGNSAASYGAVRIANASSVTISQTLFASNTATGSAAINAGRGGAGQINNISGNVSLTNVEVSGNTANAERGGLGILTVGGSVTVTDSGFIGNRALGSRIGGLEISTDNLTASACLGTSKNAVTLNGVSIRGNLAVTGTGGFRVFCSGAVTINDSEIVGNIVDDAPPSGAGIGAGAGFINDNTSVAMTNVLVADNETYSTTNNGFGVLKVSSNNSFTGTRLTVRNNFASENEGGISLTPGAASRLHEISNSAFYGNRAKSIMALLLNNTGDYIVRNSTFAGNGSITTGGSVVSINPNSSSGTNMVTLENLTIARNGGNDAPLGVGTFGGGTPNASISIKNTILGQYQFGTGAPPVINAIGGVSYNIVNSLIENNFGVPSGICGVNGVTCNLDAKLESLNNNGGNTSTLALRAGSPALDAGASVSITTDQRGAGFPRVVGAAVDIGAFESAVLTAALPCKLDMDGDNQVLAMKEGLVLLRAMLGFTSNAAVANTGITEPQWSATRVNLNSNCGTNLP
jgi:CSLREA domain-containing protein